MRCIQCDANDQGLSLYQIENTFGKSFHQLPNGDCLCGECMTWADELESDYYLSDEEQDD